MSGGLSTFELDISGDSQEQEDAKHPEKLVEQDVGGVFINNAD